MTSELSSSTFENGGLIPNKCNNYDSNLKLPTTKHESLKATQDKISAELPLTNKCQSLGNGKVDISSPSFSFKLDVMNGCRPISLHNKLTGDVLDLSNSVELEVEIDKSYQLIWLEGWNWEFSEKDAVCPDLDSGFLSGYHLFDYPDIQENLKNPSKWKKSVGLFNLNFANNPYWGWARTRFFLPEIAKGKPLNFKLGGFGIGDFCQTRVFVNGILIGERKVETRWFEPGNYLLEPNNPLYSNLRFGQVNILALQLGGAINRSIKLNEKDLNHNYQWPYQHVLQPPYFQHIEIGEKPLKKLKFDTESYKIVEASEGQALRVFLKDKEEKISAELSYRICDNGKTLIKSVSITNQSGRPVRILNLKLGDYKTASKVTEGDMGFPVYADDSFFFTLDHPAGWAMGLEGRIQLRQFPGKLLDPGQVFTCMNAIIGVADAGHAREAFLEHLTPHTRRVSRNHDRVYAIAQVFGSWQISPDLILSDELSAEVCLDCINRLKSFKDKTGERFDLLSIAYWQDPTADLIKTNSHFPNGFNPVYSALNEAELNYGLGVDSSMYARWHIGLNPLVQNCLTGQPSYASFLKDNIWVYAPTCRAAEPLRSIFTNAFLYHVKQKNARLLIFDNLISTCHNHSHDHLPGVYSTEAIYDSVIEFLSTIDKAKPEVFIMLYWGYRSPWWLLYADTIFECGLKIEASTPSPTPSLYIRDGVTITLDQGTSFSSDIPKICKDSLGVWLSRWPWNSSIGKERWQEGLIMDMCRGSLLFQIWLGEDKLDSKEEYDLARLLRLMRMHPKCFASCRLIIGDPWKNEPYGYMCSDGTRAFVAVNNFAWSDYKLSFDNFDELGLKSSMPVSIFRHYPEPAELISKYDYMRPFQVSLYEIVSKGEESTSDIAFPKVLKEDKFENSTSLSIEATKSDIDDIELDTVFSATAAVYDEIKEIKSSWQKYIVSGKMPKSDKGGKLVICAIASKNGKAVPTGSMGSFFKARASIDELSVDIKPVLPDKTYPATWQAWRIESNASQTERHFNISIYSALSQDILLEFRAYFIPNSLAEHQLN